MQMMSRQHTLRIGLCGTQAGHGQNGNFGPALGLIGDLPMLPSCF
jgi:hypothetical protein